MNKKLNCWEKKNCDKLDCPARSETKLDGIHGGKNGGRACWVIAGTKCKDAPQGKFAKELHRKLQDCKDCDFYQVVRKEEGMFLRNTLFLLNILHPAQKVYNILYAQGWQEQEGWDYRSR